MVHNNTEDLHDLAAKLLAFTEQLRHRMVLLGSINGSDAWNDAQYRRFIEELASNLRVLSQSANVLDLLAVRASGLSQRLEMYLGYAPVRSTITNAFTPSARSARSEPTSLGSFDPVPVGRDVPPADGTTCLPVPVGTVLPGTNLRVCDLEEVKAWNIDWGEDEFDTNFDRSTHHGYSGKMNRDFVSHLPALLGHFQNGGSADSIPPDSPAGRLYISLKRDPIRLERNGDRFQVTDGRHRLYAMIGLEINPPIEICGDMA